MSALQLECSPTESFHPTSARGSPFTLASVLVVEEDILIQQLVLRTLEASNYLVTLASDSAEALDCIAASIPDVIIIDLEQPAGDGAELLSRLHDDPQASSVPALVLTTNDSPEAAASCSDLGAADLLAKPFQPAELLVRIDRLERMSTAQQQSIPMPADASIAQQPEYDDPEPVRPGRSAVPALLLRETVPSAGRFALGVGIFLCGVLVGAAMPRGNPDETPRESVESAPPVDDVADRAATQPADARTVAAPPSLTRSGPPPHTPPTPTVVNTPETGDPEPPSTYTVQVAAFRTRPPALAIADRLVAKGLPAYVADPVSADAMEYFRVRVGHYDERVDANRVRQQLIADGSLDPWVVRSATPATR